MLKFRCWAFTVLLLFIVSLLFLSGAKIRSPELILYAKMGSGFSTIDVKLDIKPDVEASLYPSIYYLAIAKGFATDDPDAEKILSYINGTITEGLQEGLAVRGQWTASSQYDGQVLSLSGGENVNRILGETGFIDGYRYDLFMISLIEDPLAEDSFVGASSVKVAVARDIMAMPFDSMGKDKTFTIRALDKVDPGRQLANIGRLADLYYETQGNLGTLDFLSYKYILVSDIDLQGYENWKPINFNGEFDGGGYCIKNLQIRLENEAESTLKNAYGLFGTLENAVIRNLHMESANISLEYPCKLGTLAGEAINTNFENIQIENVQVSGGVSTGGIVGEMQGSGTLNTCRFNGKVSGFCNVGGLVGKAYSDDKLGITIKNGISRGMVSIIANDNITHEKSSESAESAIGGLAGTITGCTVVDSVSAGSALVSTGGGSIGGFIGKASNSAFKGCQAIRDIKGKDQAGGFVGDLSGKIMLVACYAFGDVYGEKDVGGFVGSTNGNTLTENANHSIKIVQCHSSGMAQAEKGSAGGFAGSLAYTAVDGCSAEGDIWSTGTAAGGFVGQLTNKSRITNACAYGSVNNTDGIFTGGFVGLITHGSCIEYSFSAGDVVGKGYTGGFAGSIATAGAPNTLFGCLSFAQWILSNDDGGIHRIVGKMEHKGVNNCYAYLGSVVAVTDIGEYSASLRHVHPNAYGSDGGDFNNQTIEGILVRLGWDRHYWSFDWEQENEDPTQILYKPRIISGYRQILPVIVF